MTFYSYVSTVLVLPISDTVLHSFMWKMLHYPILSSVQEPTSGLDSSSALNLMETLRRLAVDENKTIVTSIHQPSSQLFHLSDDLLLMAKGKV